MAMYPDDRKLYIGTYMDHLLICASDIPMESFEADLTQTERNIIRIFSNAEICAIVLQSTVNFWGYSIIKAGQNIRARAGSADDGTLIDIGQPLEEEKDLLAKSSLDKDGKNVYLLEDFPDEPFAEDQVGENFVFSIWKRYFGEELDTAYESLFETILTVYKYGKGPTDTIGDSKERTTRRSAKPSWKSW